MAAFLLTQNISHGLLLRKVSLHFSYEKIPVHLEQSLMVFPA
jgi:hypothetical protein